MNIQATQVVAKHLNKAFQARDWGYTAKQVWLTEREYAWNVGDTIDAEMNGDYNYNKGLFRAIRIEYPSEYYACPRYISTEELRSWFRQGDTLGEFTARCLDNLEI